MVRAPFRPSACAIGIGIAPAAPASCDQDHFPVTVESAPQVPDRIAALEGRGDDPLPALLAVARRLLDAGCDLIAMPCNSASVAQFNDGCPVTSR